MRARFRSFVPGRLGSTGFTLIEMMVTLVIFAVVAVTLTLVIMNSARNKTRTNQRIESEQGARAALDLMARDIRTAGYGVDIDHATPQPAIAYVDSMEIILSENQLPYPETVSNGHGIPLAYAPTGNPKPFPLNATPYTPPARYRTGAELIRYTLDVNNDGVVDASDVSAPQGADAAATSNPNDFTLVRQVYGDSTGGTLGNNGGTTERVALVRRPGSGVPSLFSVYMKGSATPWDWASGAVPQNQLKNIERVAVAITATSSRPDSRGQYAQTTLTSQVNASRSVPDFGSNLYSVSGYVFNDVVGPDGVKDASDPGLPNATVRLGTFIAYTNASGYFQFNAPAGSYVLRHTAPMGYGSYSNPDTFNVIVTGAAISRSFADTARAGGNVSISVFKDANTNGLRDYSEVGMQGIKVSIDLGSPGATSGITDASGNLTLFTGVGGYQVTCNKADSLSITTGNNPYSGTMINHGSGSVAFGLSDQSTGDIQGTVFVDGNRNGTLDGTDIGVNNVWVGVTKDGGQNVLGYAYTDASGAYDVVVPTNDPPHTEAYSVFVVPPGGYFPTTGTSINNIWVTGGSTLKNKDFGMANYQIITLTASRVLSLAAADVMEKDWSGNKPETALHDTDLLLGADAGGTDNVSVWFNKYPNSKAFNPAPIDPDGYTRLAPNSVMAMAVDTLDKRDLARPDVVTGTKFTAGGNFFVWFMQGTNNNEGYLPVNYSPGKNYKTQDNGDVQAVVTLDCGGGGMPDIIVGTKSATAGQGSVEVWLSDDANTPSFTRDEIYSTVGATIIGEVTGMTLSDMDNDGDKDLIVCTHTSDYNGQVIVYENRGRTTGNRFVYRYGVGYGGEAPSAVTTLDADGDGWKDIFVGTQRSTSQGRVWQFRNTGLVSLYTFSIIRAVDPGGIVQSLCPADFGGATRNDLAVGYRTSTTGYGGGIRIFYMDLGIIPNSGVDPSGGSVVNMVPALASANFNYGLNVQAPPYPYLADLAAGVKASATTGALVVFVR
jgi:prepilin-type N-terminal cleavage/methylation domain-containing protein